MIRKDVAVDEGLRIEEGRRRDDEPAGLQVAQPLLMRPAGALLPDRVSCLVTP